MPRRAVKPKERTPNWWEPSRPMCKESTRGFHMKPVDIDAVKLEAAKARELMKELTWNS